MIVRIFKNTNFGNNDLVWNVPNPNYNFDLHTSKVFTNVYMRFPLLATQIIVHGEYDFDTSFYDYMIVEDGNKKTYYFINTIIADRNSLIFSVTLDVITTHDVLSQPISGTIVRKHDTNPNENRFDYPTALDFEGNYQNEIYDVITYDYQNVTRFIESAVNLSHLDESITIPSNDGTTVTIPTLPKPEHNTNYQITTWGNNTVLDESKALTLYLADDVDEEVLNVVRGLSGDGAISDSYAVPSEAITVTSINSEVTNIRGQFVTKISDLKLEIDFSELGFNPKNEAIKGMFKVAITSMQEKRRLSFPAWDLKDSVDSDNYIKLNLWCDPKPSGAPYCCPDQVKTLHPKDDDPITALATLEVKSVRGGQWLRNPLIYSTSRGELFSTIETQLQREKAQYDRDVSMHQLELSRREREIRIAQADYNFQSGLASSLISGGLAITSGSFGSAFLQGKAIIDSTVNQSFIEQLRDLQQYEQETEKTLIKMAYSNNLKNLDVQETIRRISARNVVFEPNESLGSYNEYNGFTVSLVIPDVESLKSKDLEFSKYGYPVYESVNNFVMLNHLRENHTVYQFENPLIDIGGTIGDMVREVLRAGIRILNKPYTINNIINNPKRVI